MSVNEWRNVSTSVWFCVEISPLQSSVSFWFLHCQLPFVVVHSPMPFFFINLSREVILLSSISREDKGRVRNSEQFSTRSFFFLSSSSSLLRSLSILLFSFCEISSIILVILLSSLFLFPFLSCFPLFCFFGILFRFEIVQCWPQFFFLLLSHFSSHIWQGNNLSLNGANSLLRQERNLAKSKPFPKIHGPQRVDEILLYFSLIIKKFKKKMRNLFKKSGKHLEKYTLQTNRLFGKSWKEYGKSGFGKGFSRINITKFSSTLFSNHGACFYSDCKKLFFLFQSCCFFLIQPTN